MTNVYETLKEIVLPSMTAYQTDLITHDRASIEQHPECHFLHWASERHTVIVFLPEANDPEFPPAGVSIPHLFGTADREDLADQIVSMAEYHVNPCNGKPLFVHHWDGKRLKRIDVDTALRIARDHRAMLRNAWDRKVVAA